VGSNTATKAYWGEPPPVGFRRLPRRWWWESRIGTYIAWSNTSARCRQCRRGRRYPRQWQLRTRRVAAQKCRVDKAGSGGIQLGHKCGNVEELQLPSRRTAPVLLGSRVADCLVRSGGYREIGRVCLTGHVGAATGVHRDGVAVVIAVAAQIGGINQRTAIRTEFRYKSRRPLPGRDAPPLLCRRRALIRVLRREVDRVGVARHIDTARAVHRETLRDTDLRMPGPVANPM
jgi:hypothetical protein